ncbi:Hypothetical protein FKW44_015093, partial [Caligus rogercresseyi]
MKVNHIVSYTQTDSDSTMLSLQLEAYRRNAKRELSLSKTLSIDLSVLRSQECVRPRRIQDIQTGIIEPDLKIK